MSRPSRLTDATARTCAATGREYTLHDAVLRGFALRVHPSGVKTWVLRVRRDGRQRRLTIGNALTVPVDQARHHAHAILSGHVVPDEPAAPNVSTALRFDQFAPIYLERRGPAWRPSTRTANEVYLCAKLLPAFGGTPMDRIGPSDVATWFFDYSRTRPGGANRALAVLSDVFSRAVDWGFLPFGRPNPCKAIRRNRSRPCGQVLNHEALSRLGTVLERYSRVRPDTVEAIRLLLLTGARPGEIFRLRWSEFDGDRLLLPRAKRGPRSIALGAAALAILRARRKRRGDSPYVFPHPRLPDQPRPLPTDWTWRVMKREAALPGELRLHDLRHNFASHAVLTGESLLVAGALLGHRRPGMTARYTHLADDSLSAAAQRIAKAIAEGAAG